MGLGAKWSARTEISQLKSDNSLLQVENGNYREATGELTGQIQSLEGVINDLGERATLDPEQVRAMQKLPAVVKSRAVGGVEPNRAISQVVSSLSPLSSPEDTFGVLRDLLQGLENRLTYVRRNVEKREALAAATPSIWPAHGWLTGTFGGRPDPFTGEPDYHQGLDISTDKGNPVYATADGTVTSAARAGQYGNLIVLDARLQPVDSLRTSEPVQRPPRATRQARRHHRLRRLDRPLDRRAPALRDSRQRQADQSVAAPHPAFPPPVSSTLAPACITSLTPNDAGGSRGAATISAVNAVEPATGRYRFRDLLVVLLAAWAARTAFILLMPPAYSLDARHWYEVAEALAQGRNPYSVTYYLNWPPLWMQVTWAIAQLNTLTQLPFPRILQIVLILIESAAIVALFRLLRLLAPAADIRLALLAGISLNPIAILLICQHVNFDVIVALWIVLFVTSLVRFQRSGDAVDWLAACLFLGFAVLTKTVPIVLAPLLAHGARGLSSRGRWLGAALVLGPVTLGMSIIYVLDPAGVTEHVIAYRSFAGYFGISGLSALLGVAEAGSWWAAWFPSVLVASLMWIGLRLWQRANLSGGDIVVLAAMLLMIVPALGPGYGPNYIYWFLPLLVASAATEAGAWRKLLIGFYAVAALTYLVEYAMFDTHGMFLVRLLPENQQVARWSQEWSSAETQTVIRLPLFVGYLALLWGGASLLRRRLSVGDVKGPNFFLGSLARCPMARTGRDAARDSSAGRRARLGALVRRASGIARQQRVGCAVLLERDSGGLASPLGDRCGPVHRGDDPALGRPRAGHVQCGVDRISDRGPFRPLQLSDDVRRRFTAVHR